MGRTVIKKLSGKIEKESLAKLAREFKGIGSAGELDIFLNKFMTAGEKQTLLRRFAVMGMIEQGVKYRKIKEILEVSGNTISNAKDIMAGRGYGRNPDRRRKYSPSAGQKKRRPYRLKYKGADGLATLLDSF